MTVAAVVVALLATGCAAAPAPVRELSVEATVPSGPLDADAITDVTVEVRADGPTEVATVDDVVVRLDDRDDTPAADIDGAVLTYRPADLEDGDHDLAVVLPAPEDSEEDDEVLGSWSFSVDTTPPELTLDEPDTAVVAGEPATLTGTTEPGLVVTLGRHETTADDDGAFEIEVAKARAGRPYTASVADAAGNTAEASVELMTIPSRVEVDEVRAVHVSFYGWVSSKREPILKMIRDGRINAVQLDLKDEAGQVGYDTEVPAARRSGAAADIYDLDDAVAELHDLGVPVIGRIVAFADPIYTKWSWRKGHRDRVIQTPDGQRYTGRYDGFSNPAHPEVIDYNLDIAEEAARAGVDHILWDYIRRPDGSLDNMVLPGLETTPEKAVVAFTRMADERLAPYGIQHAASVYGIAADRPTQMGQYIPGMARHLDYVSPMIYPSHWAPGEYGVKDPNRQPYAIITQTLKVWKRVTRDRRARVVPWLEDTTYRAWDRPHQVREQIRATRDRGIDEFIMWDPHVDYTVGAYQQRDR
jgi:hypothetical protein